MSLSWAEDQFGDRLAADGTLVRENFTRWFGDSRMVDAAGAPLTLYHGTDKTFDSFRPSSTGAEGPGIYLASDPKMAEGYGTTVLSLYAAVRNPFIFFPSDESIDAEVNGELIEQVLCSADCELVLDRLARMGAAGYGTEVREALVAKGHDGILVVHPPNFGASQLAGLNRDFVLVAFDGRQVKSMTDNCGLYDASSDDLCDRPVYAARGDRVRA